LGELRPAQEFIEQAIERAVASGHVWNQLNAYYYKGLLEMIGGMAGAALQAYDTVLKLCGAHGSNLFLPFASMGADWAHARLGETEPALTSLREMLTKHIDQGNKLWMPLHRGLVAEIEAEARSAEQALSTIEAALLLAAQTGEHWTDSLLHRIRGEILLKREPANTAAAEEAFHMAITIARQQTARSFELRAAMSLAGLWRDQGKVRQARELLAPVYGWFTEGFDTLDLKEAKALLEELAA
jgi:predicted ATPase